jgi:hypothetical protein
MLLLESKGTIVPFEFSGFSLKMQCLIPPNASKKQPHFWLNTLVLLVIYDHLKYAAHSAAKYYSLMHLDWTLTYKPEE